MNSALKTLVGLVMLLVLTCGVTHSKEQGSQTLTAEEIRQGALDFLVDTLFWEPESMDTEIIYERGDLTLPAGDLELEYRMTGKTRRAGRIPLSLQIKVDGKFQHRLRLSSNVTVYFDVVKTRRPVRKGKLLERGDLEIEHIKSKRVLKNAATRLEDVMGYESVRYLQSGQVIKLDSITKPPMVKKGDRVILMVTKGPMKITAPGISTEKGFENDMIQVMNTQSKKKVYGRVIDQDTVEITY